MDATLLAGLIGACATILAAIIGAIALFKTQKPSNQQTSTSRAPDEVNLPYRLHRDEMDRKEREVRELMKIVLLYKQQARLTGEELAAAKRYGCDRPIMFRFMWLSEGHIGSPCSKIDPIVEA